MQNHWFSHSVYVDITTGQKLTREEATNESNYQIIKTHRNVKQFKPTESRRYIEYVNECRPIEYKQLQLF